VFTGGKSTPRASLQSGGRCFLNAYSQIHHIEKVFRLDHPVGGILTSSLLFSGAPP